jgi:peroxiredoxin Q/BCP
VIGMSADTPKELANWKKKKNLPYTLISDPERKVIDRFHAYGERSFLGKAYMGIIRSHFVFDTEGKLIEGHNGIKPQDSIDQGVAALTKT